jgi:dipeptidyl aminopeptidase/acylaminoacyl peptidase
MKKIGKKIIKTVPLIIGLATASVIFWLFLKNYYQNSPKNNPENKISRSSVTMSREIEEEAVSKDSELFEEITIPYLRNRGYVSELKDLNLLNEYSGYTSYLTGYDSDGLNINGLLTVPKGDKPEAGWPAIVFVHCYIPPDQYKTTENYSAYVDYLAKNGFVVFKIDLRGHGDSEGEPGGAYYSGDYIIDTLNAYSALQASDFVDEDNVGLWGHSMGGNVVFRSFVAKRDIKAVSIWAGAVYTYVDFSEYGISDNSYRPPSQESETRRKRNELFETHGSFDPQDEFWMKVVPTNYLAGVRGTLQLNHSIDDNVVSVEYTRNLSSILMETNIEYEVNEYPTGGHNISGAAFNNAMQNTVEFFKNQLTD